MIKNVAKAREILKKEKCRIHCHEGRTSCIPDCRNTASDCLAEGYLSGMEDPAVKEMWEAAEHFLMDQCDTAALSLKKALAHYRESLGHHQPRGK